LNNLALLHFDTGAYLDAKQLLDRAIAIEEASLGERDPELIVTLENYAIVLRELRRHEEAEKAETRAKDLRAQLSM
jgi:tetratricopeptide (TPR) repeat protein